MPETLDDNLIKSADAAVAYAAQVRKFHRRRTSRTAQQRRTDIEVALTRIREAMSPLRSEIGRFPYGPQTTAAEDNRERIRQASDRLQRERRKLWKMKNRDKEE